MWNGGCARKTNLSPHLVHNNRCGVRNVQATIGGHAVAEIFAPDVDPVDPGEPPTETFSSNFTGKRLNVGDD